MFTGLVEEIGKIISIEKSSRSYQFMIEANNIITDMKIGDSIATNGICLTVVSIKNNIFTVDIINETIKVSTLGDYKINDKLNLERALKLSDRIGGHIVSGHIDGTGEITNFEKLNNSTIITIECEMDILKYIILRGSIAIDGVSLTVCSVQDNYFQVSIIPHTSKETTLLNKDVRDKVNLETDIVAKYTEKLIGYNNSKAKNKQNITKDFLIENGF